MTMATGIVEQEIHTLNVLKEIEDHFSKNEIKVESKVAAGN